MKKIGMCKIDQDKAVLEVLGLRKRPCPGRGESQLPGRKSGEIRKDPSGKRQRRRMFHMGPYLRFFVEI